MNRLIKRIKTITERFVPAVFYQRILHWWRCPHPKHVRWGNLRRLEPISRVFGLDRGMPIDRYYIEAFLALYRSDIHGRVLEIGNSDYTCRFGANRVMRSDVLHAVPGNPFATVVGDLITGEGIPVSAFDCLIFTQTFPFIYDVRSAIAHSFAALKPGGILLATMPGISQISRYDMDRWGDYWRFTDASVKRLFGTIFGAENVITQTHGNVLVACAFLHGLATHELKRQELDALDPDCPLIITVRAIKGL